MSRIECCGMCDCAGRSACEEEARDELRGELEDRDRAAALEWLSFVAEDYRPHMLAAVAKGAGEAEALRWTWDHMMAEELDLGPLGADGWKELQRELGL